MKQGVALFTIIVGLGPNHFRKTYHIQHCCTFSIYSFRGLYKSGSLTCFAIFSQILYIYRQLGQLYECVRTIQKANMDDIQLYLSDPEGWDDGKNDQTEPSTSCSVRNAATVNEIDHRDVRQVYLLTYSKANLCAFPTRMSFPEAVVASFSGKESSIIQWVCCRESHKNDGLHYHMAIKLDRCQRWLGSKKFLTERYGISVHFSNKHFNYYSAWQYVTKVDEGVIESTDHPYLWNATAPRTSRACEHKTNKRIREADDVYEADEAEDEGTEERKPRKTNKKKKRITAFELSEIILEKEIKTRTELLALANEQKCEGKTDIAEFVFNRRPKVVAEVLNTAWEMNTAHDRLCRSRKSLIEILREAEQTQCVPQCNGLWIASAKQVLQRNGVDVKSFSDAVKEALDKGRGKYRNIMIVGPANCGKTFMLNPLNTIYNTFSNPACSSFAWVGAEEAECIFLNDFRWSQQTISWHDFLLMLEGQLVHLPEPKTHYAKDIVFQNDTPIFSTGKHSIIYIKNGVIDERETEMMSVRWRVFNFSYQIPAEQQIDIPPCPKCFSSLILGLK